MDSTFGQLGVVILSSEKRARPNEIVRTVSVGRVEAAWLGTWCPPDLSESRQFSDADYRRFVHVSASECAHP